MGRAGGTHCPTLETSAGARTFLSAATPESSPALDRPTAAKRLQLAADSPGASAILSAESSQPIAADKNVRAPQKGQPAVGRRRKQEGAVYTPAFITPYLVEQALGGVLKARLKTLRRQHEAEAAGTARKALADPNAYDLAALNEPQRKALRVLPRLRAPWAMYLTDVVYWVKLLVTGSHYDYTRRTGGPMN